MEADFSGYASKAGLKCSDGRTILAHAFKSNDGQRVPLLWNHMHDDPENVLGHAVLEDREDGTYVYGFFNETPKAQSVKAALKHGDFDALSVFANKLIQKGSDVIHGMIREVSLVLAGANPGARIENVSLAHGDGGIEELEDEAIIHSGENIVLAHAEDDEDTSNSEEEGPSPEEVYNTLNEDQKVLVDYLVAGAQKAGAEAQRMKDDESEDSDSDNDDDENTQSDSAQHSDITDNSTDSEEEDSTMSHTVFDKNTKTDSLKHNLTREQLAELTHSAIETAKKPGYTLKEAILQHAADYGVENIDYLFPDAKLIANQPEMLSRQMEWVQKVIGGTKHSPFSRIKTLVADITAEAARAKGYVKGNLKKEEVIKLLKRTTDPTTIYKKQKLDRDDILDITDLDIVAWLKAEMILMLNEEIARAILLGDGRSFDDEDKIDEDKIRPIANDDAFYSHPVSIAADATVEAKMEAIIRAHDDHPVVPDRHAPREGPARSSSLREHLGGCFGASRS